MRAVARTITTRFLIISDTHSKQELLAVANNPLSRMPNADVLLHCGDLSYVGSLEEYHVTLNLLANINAELKLVIAGNHDLSLDRAQKRHKLNESHYTEALELWTGEEAKKCGIQYLTEGLHHFRLSSGALFTVYASPYQPEFMNWAFAYNLNEDRWNPPNSIFEKLKDPALRAVKNIATTSIPDFPAVDILMTHGPPAGHLDTTFRGDEVGCRHLMRALQRVKPRIHCFGHIHEGYGAETIDWNSAKPEVKTTPITIDKRRAAQHGCVKLDVSAASAAPLQFGRSTVVVNASILNERYMATNMPWLVEIELPGEKDEEVPDQHEACWARR